jgi:ABC-2 type transport system ATP-binding protein
MYDGRRRPAVEVFTDWGTERPSDTVGRGAAIIANRLHRVYTRRGRLFSRPEGAVAVAEVSFAAPDGTIFGLLGPNGAGKTTTIKMLSTLLIPTSGRATVGGYDVVRDERMVRRQLGVVLGGDRGLYGDLTAWDNLVYFGNLYGMTSACIKRRAVEVLELVGLRERAEERVEGYSRGMKQRLHLAKALLHDPPILILDEPTIGLDPAAAVDLRRAIAALVPERTVLLTTHDMHEADQLCREIAIIDHGRIVAQGSPTELKQRVEGERRIVVTTRERLEGSGAEIEEQFAQLPWTRSVRRAITAGGAAEFTILCAEIAATLDAALAILRDQEASVSSIQVIEPTLEDVFLSIAGRSLG